jgi:quercetin dioxygenase-like cupin family protein
MTLANIAQALEINLRNLFESEGDQIHVARAADGPEQCGETSQVLRLPLTIPDNSWKLEVNRLTLPPEAPCLEFEPYPGEVMGFVLDGALMLVIDDEKLQLEAGDSIHYDANQPYRLGCHGDRPCSVIWCNSPPRRDKVAIREIGVAGK